MNLLFLFITNQLPGGEKPVKDIVTQFFAFVYSIAHYIGLGIVEVIKLILPMLENLDALVDPIGFLAILTIFIVIVSVARKIAWIIVIVGWVLILLRMVLMILNIG
ncbi:MAG: hypothetical protein ACUVQT_06910 [bacterium]